MAANPFIDNLCQKTHAVFKILEETDCNLSDDTYLDHMVTGIKNEMRQYDNSNECLEFYRKSQCSRFVNAFNSASTGCQNFILKLLVECWKNWWKKCDTPGSRVSGGLNIHFKMPNAHFFVFEHPSFCSRGVEFVQRVRKFQYSLPFCLTFSSRPWCIEWFNKIIFTVKKILGKA